VAALQGDTVTANVFVVGMAVGAGCLPIRWESIERAIELNGVAVEANREAFRWGHAQIADPQALQAALEASAARRDARLTPAGALPLAPGLPSPLAARIASIAGGEDAFAEQLELWTTDLIAYQDLRHAAGYLTCVEQTAARESDVKPGSQHLTRAVARSLHKLLAYKDEYEVARLMLDRAGQAPALALASPGVRIAWQLHPPLLRALGLRRKLSIGLWATPLIRGLAAAKRLRGSRFDPFGWPRLRRIERALPAQYRDAVASLLEHLKPHNLDEAASIAALPDDIRGYESLKLARVAEYRQRLAERLDDFCG
jgi:indolepyruvate ferredoxin oxidoreductase